MFSVPWRLERRGLGVSTSRIPSRISNALANDHGVECVRSFERKYLHTCLMIMIDDRRLTLYIITQLLSFTEPCTGDRWPLIFKAPTFQQVSTGFNAFQRSTLPL